MLAVLCLLALAANALESCLPASAPLNPGQVCTPRPDPLKTSSLGGVSGTVLYNRRFYWPHLPFPYPYSSDFSALVDIPNKEPSPDKKPGFYAQNTALQSNVLGHQSVSRGKYDSRHVSVAALLALPWTLIGE